MITREQLLSLLQSGKTPEDLASAFTSTLNEAMTEARRLEEEEAKCKAAEEAKFEVFSKLYQNALAYVELVSPGLIPPSEKEPTIETMNAVDKTIKSIGSMRSAVKKLEDLGQPINLTPIFDELWPSYFDSFFN